MHVPDLAIKTKNNASILPTLIFAFFCYCAIRLLLKWKTRELSEREQIIGLWKGGRTHEAINRVLKFPKSTVTDTIVRYKNFNTGLTAKRRVEKNSI